MSARDLNAGVTTASDAVHKSAEDLSLSDVADPVIAKRIAAILETVAEEIRALALEIGEARK